MSEQARYAAAGCLLSVGAPAGLFLVRAILGQAEWRRPLEDGEALQAVYTYVAVSTAIAFAAFGAVLGRAADRLLRLATEDPLTRLLNRRAMDSRLEQELQRARRYGGALSLMLLDVDRLKQVNDVHGHAAGDRALLRVTSAILGQCRATDIAARWGGDEFLLAAVSTDADAAARLAERIREGVAASEGVPELTVSIGVATLAKDEMPSVGAVIARADEALYDAKQLGRNRVVTSTGRK